MTDDIKEKAMMLAIQARPGRPAHELIDDAAQIEAYLRGDADEPPEKDADEPPEKYVPYRDAPAQSIALDEAEERDDD